MITPGIIGFNPSATKACSTWLSIGSRNPAMAATRELLPATAMPTLLAPIGPRVVSTPLTRPSSIADAGDLAVLDDVDAAIAGAAGKAPGHGVMPHRAAAGLQQPALDRKPRVVEIEERREPAHAFAIEQFGIDTVHSHRIATSRKGVALAVRMVEVQHAALADHGVVVEFLLQPLPELHRQFIEREVSRQQIVGADDRGVTADIAAADPAFLQHGDIADAVSLAR